MDKMVNLVLCKHGREDKVRVFEVPEGISIEAGQVLLCNTKKKDGEIAYAMSDSFVIPDESLDAYLDMMTTTRKVLKPITGSLIADMFSEEEEPAEEPKEGPAPEDVRPVEGKKEEPAEEKDLEKLVGLVSKGAEVLGNGIDAIKVFHCGVSVGKEEICEMLALLNEQIFHVVVNTALVAVAVKASVLSGKKEEDE